MLEIPNCGLIVVDVQGKLAQLMVDKEALFKNITILIQAANARPRSRSNWRALL